DARELDLHGVSSPYAFAAAATERLTLGAGRRFSIPDRSERGQHQARGHLLRPRVVARPIGGWALTNQLRETRAEPAHRLAAYVVADFGNRQVTPAEQRHRPLDPAGHQIAVRALAESHAEAPREVAGRHARSTGERLDIEGTRVLTIHLIFRAPQADQ